MMERGDVQWGVLTWQHILILISSRLCQRLHHAPATPLSRAHSFAAMAALYVAAGAFAVLQFFADNPGVTAVMSTMLADEAALLRRRLSAQRAAWPAGPCLEFDQARQTARHVARRQAMRSGIGIGMRAAPRKRLQHCAAHAEPSPARHFLRCGAVRR
jgi:hypothetical protein